MSGIERKIDNLGRIVIPISYRKALRLKSEDSLTISLKKDEIIISAKNTSALYAVMQWIVLKICVCAKAV